MKNDMTTAEHLEYNNRLIAYTLAQANADGRPLAVLFASAEWRGNVNARFVIYEGMRDSNPEWNSIVEDALDNTNEFHPMRLRVVDDTAYIDHHRAQSGGSIDPATWGR